MPLQAGALEPRGEREGGGDRKSRGWRAGPRPRAPPSLLKLAD